MDFNKQLLIALPDMQDSRFEKALILICEHNKDGAMGLVLNHPMELTTNQVFDDMGLEQSDQDQPIFNGGPLKSSSGFVIHRNNQSYKSSIKITNNLSLTTSKDVLKNIANNTLTDKWRFILGYSGWTKNQLEQEIAQNTWLTCPLDNDLIFNTDSQDQWQKALSIIGIDDYSRISGIGHA